MTPLRSGWSHRTQSLTGHSVGRQLKVMALSIMQFTSVLIGNNQELGSRLTFHLIHFGPQKIETKETELELNTPRIRLFINNEKKKKRKKKPKKKFIGLLRIVRVLLWLLKCTLVQTRWYRFHTKAWVLPQNKEKSVWCFRSEDTRLLTFICWKRAHEGRGCQTTKYLLVLFDIYFQSMNGTV